MTAAGYAAVMLGVFAVNWPSQQAHTWRRDGRPLRWSSELGAPLAQGSLIGYPAC
jgi:hypothetical protein